MRTPSLAPWGLAAITILLAACGAPVHRGPVVLITIDALRADAVTALGGPPGLTPNLDRLAAEASWKGRAVSPSSWTVPAMASLFTGLQPWSHRAWEGAHAELRQSLTTLPERLRERGYSTTAFRSNHWLQRDFGYAQGFDAFRGLQHGRRAADHLAALEGGREFVWIHVLPPHAPYVRTERLLPRLAAPPPQLPRRLRPLDLEPYFDPAIPLQPVERERAWALYCLNVARADELVGLLLDGLRRSGRWDETLLAVTADHGEEFEEDRQVLHGGNLGRALIEVPLLLKLPRGWRHPPAIAAMPGTVHLAATLVEATGGEPDAAMAPSLLRPDRAGEEGVLSELYLGNGVNEFSLVDAGRQLRWWARFAPAERFYYAARLQLMGGPPAPGLAEPPAALFRRLELAFGRTPPLSGSAPPELSLATWSERGAVPLDDPALRERMARRLRQRFRELNGEEVPPDRVAGSRTTLSSEDAAALRALGYAAGDP